MMNWNQLLSAKRFGLEEYHSEHPENRSEFQRDYDRLIFSAPFRRLQNKTQVFPLPGSIFVHNRLTHSLEVSCVGRSLGNDVARALLASQPELHETFLAEIGSIVSAACLAHDLGNPPFGHSGERAISTFFSEGGGLALRDRLTDAEWSDLTHFEGNANAFRLLTHQFEGRRRGGFVLTYSTLASIVKYPYSSSLAGKKSKFGFFTTEEDSFRRIAEELGMEKLNDAPLKYARHPLVYLVEAADDICYQMMDLEDAHKLKIMTTAETQALMLSFFTDERKARMQKTLQIVSDTNEQIAYLRSCVIGLLIPHRLPARLGLRTLRRRVVRTHLPLARRTRHRAGRFPHHRHPTPADDRRRVCPGEGLLPVAHQPRVKPVQNKFACIPRKNTGGIGLYFGHDRRLCARPLP